MADQIPGNTEVPLYPDEDIIEILTKFESLDRYPLPVTYAGPSWGDGGVDHYPAVLEDGIIMTRQDESRFTSDQRNALGLLHNDYYDFAPNANGPIYMVFTGNMAKALGFDKKVVTYDKTSDPYTPNFTGSGATTKPAYDPDYKPASFESWTPTGIVHSALECWLGAKYFQEGSLASLAQGDKITVLKGKFKKWVSGNVHVGTVEKVNTSITGSGRKKVRVRLNLSNPQPRT